MSATLQADFLEAVRSSIHGSSLTTPSRWVASKMFIPNPVTQDVENLSWKYHPWMKGMLDSEAPYNYAMKGAQLGVTVVGICITFFNLDVPKRHVLYVLPTAQIASNFSKARFNPALAYSPEIKAMFTDTNTVTLKVAGRANLYITGSRGEGNLKEKPASVLILDEVDAMEQKMVYRALERLSGHLHKTVWGISTPTIPNYGIHKMYMTGTREHFFFPCPGCSRHIELTKDNLIVCGDHIYDPRIVESHIKCVKCDRKIHQEEKPEILAKASWVSQNSECNPERRSFHVNQLYSYTISPQELAEAHFRAIGDEAAAQELWNSKFGLPRVGEGAQVSDEMIDKAIESGPGHTIHAARPTYAGERFTTLGIDRGKTCHFVVCEWHITRMGADLNATTRSTLLDYGTFYEGDLFKRFYELLEEWQILHAVLDMDPGPEPVRQLAKDNFGFVHGCRYRAGQSGQEITEVDDNGALVATVDNTTWIDKTIGRFRTNRIHLPTDINDEFRRHMKALVRCYVRKERKTENGLILPGPMVLEFLKTDEDHYAQALTYAEIALPFAAAESGGQNVSEYL